VELIWFIRLVNETRQTAFWQRFSEVFMRNLTKSGDYVLVVSLQPKSGFLPGAGCGRPKILKVEDGANEVRQLISRPLSRPSPTANLVGNWKGDPLIREVRGLKFTPSKTIAALSRSSRSVAYWTNYAGRDLHRNGGLVFCGLRALRARLRKALTKSFMENLILGIISLALCVYLIVAMIRPEKF
jgi:K+-transporting ATPase KdpF subunit